VITVNLPDRPKDFPDEIYQLLRNIVFMLNGNISLGNGDNQSQSGNVLGKYIVVTTPAAANTDFTIYHGLGYIPKNFIATSGLTGTLYLSPAIAADSKTLTLRSGAVSTELRIWIF